MGKLRVKKCSLLSIENYHFISNLKYGILMYLKYWKVMYSSDAGTEEKPQV